MKLLKTEKRDRVEDGIKSRGTENGVLERIKKPTNWSKH